MVSKSQIKLVRQLRQKKHRDQHQLFVAEGLKVIREFIDENYQLHQLYALDERHFPSQYVSLINQTQMKAISDLKAPSEALAVFAMPKTHTSSQSDLVLALDSIQDPGNFGTIIRICDWFGIQDIICSLDTVDCYNPKVVRSTMGSLARVQVFYKDLESWLMEVKDFQIVATSMTGQSIYKHSFDTPTVLLIGNEGRGLSKQLAELSNKTLSIPRFGSAESLNAAMATGIILAEARRHNSIEK
ncbi:MAG: RNA methyltransferase [Bacteroidota bacterium]|nr:RNA methyltransferase [Bacteroidota bacterium]